MIWLPYAKKYDDTLNPYDTILERDRQTDRQTGRQIAISISRDSIAVLTRDKNLKRTTKYA